jgi:hypothetical protein
MIAIDFSVAGKRQGSVLAVNVLFAYLPFMPREILQKSMVAALTCLLTGVIVYGFSIFDLYRVAFQFVSTGVLASLFFFTLRLAGGRQAFLVLFVFYIIMTGLLTKGYEHGLLFRDAVYVAAVGAAIFLFSTRVYRRDHLYYWLSPVVLGALLGAVMLIAAFLLLLAAQRPAGRSLISIIPGIWHMVVMNFVIGLGLGTGFVLSEYLPSSVGETGNQPKQ